MTTDLRISSQPRAPNEEPGFCRKNPKYTGLTVFADTK
jgi:hypothetical protein